MAKKYQEESKKSVIVPYASSGWTLVLMIITLMALFSNCMFN